jgi:hypothetical protein
MGCHCDILIKGEGCHSYVSERLCQLCGRLTLSREEAALPEVHFLVKYQLLSSGERGWDG